MSGRALLVLAAGVIAISWAAPLIRLASEAGASALAIAALRLTVAAPLMAGLGAASGTADLRALRARQWALLVLAAAGLAAHFGLWVASLERTSVTTSVVLVTTQPIFVGLGAWLFLGERPSRTVVTGTAVAGAGAALMVGDDWGNLGTQAGNLMALLGAVTVSVYVVVGRDARQRLSFASYTAVVYALTAAMLLGVAVAAGTELAGLSTRAYLLIAAMAGISQLIGHNAINWSLATIPAAVVAAAVLGEPVVASMLSVVLLEEVPTLLEVAGGAVVLTGVFIALRRPASVPEGYLEPAPSELPPPEQPARRS